MSGGGEDEAQGESKKEQSAEEFAEAEINRFEALLQDLESLKAGLAENPGLAVEPAEFEKDADWNFHIDFITAASNLRGWNYRMKPASRHKSKMIAGKIIPALATTTAAVTGLVMIEMLKVLQPGKKVEAFKDSSNSLGINGYFFSEPSPPIKAKDEYDPIEMSEVICKPSGFTKWDKTPIKAGSLTVQQFLDEFKKETGLNCTSLYHASANQEGAQGNSKFVYERDAWKKELKATYASRLDVKLEDIVFEIYGEAAISELSTYVPLDISTEDDDGNVYKVPQSIYFFK